MYSALTNLPLCRVQMRFARARLTRLVGHSPRRALCGETPVYVSTERCVDHSGVTVVELLIATTVVAILVGAMAVMATGLRSQQQVSQEYASTSMHGRAVLGRIQRAIGAAYANTDFPGFVVFSEAVGAYTYPDCLVVWRPAARPANPQGLPLWSEVVIFGWNPDQPSELVEVTVPGNNTMVPPLTDGAAWLSQLTVYRAGKGSRRVVLTDRLRVVAANGNPKLLRGAVCFFADLQPSAAEWNAMVSGSRSWSSLSWPLDMYGTSYGVRQHRCAIELQLRGASSNEPDLALPFFGAASLYFTVNRP